MRQLANCKKQLTGDDGITNFWGVEIFDETEVDAGFRLIWAGWVYDFETLEEAKDFIRAEKKRK
jgi:hypothetical protein|tara:strand:+ start:277 stop:468 length:192 start_codon:yes stop_codon:yes gene_type:complete